MKTLSIILFLLCAINGVAQLQFATSYIHSHNDYLQEKPLLGALEAGAKSIEIDVFLINDSLFVAHTQREIKNTNTLENLYILPLKTYLDRNQQIHEFHLMIDIKSEPVSSLNAIQKCLKNYPDIFSKEGVQVIISGNRPKPESYTSYADFIWFDARSPSDIDEQRGKRIAMISQNISKFTQWRGRGNIPENDKRELVEFINESHRKNKPVRLWNTADNETTYKFLSSIGVDYINTDHPKELRKYLDSQN